MPITIVATPGHAVQVPPSYSSFATEAEFIGYAAARLNVPAGTTVSGSACTENEKAALIEATRELNRLQFAGTRIDTTQALAAPRAYWPLPDAPQSPPPFSSIAVYLPEDAIPALLVQATCELALQFLKAGTTDLASAGADDNLKRKKTGPIEKEWFDPRDQARGLARFPRVAELVTPLLSSNAGVLSLDRV